MTPPRKVASGMLLTTLLGGLLMLPPFGLVFDQRLTHFGIPQIVLYLFVLWLLLILATAVLARTMPRDQADPDKR